MNVATVIPAYNPDPKFFADLIDCLHAQTVQPAEIVVVDDGSDEPVRAPFRVIRQANAGVSAARNRGVEATSAAAVHVLDQDELLDPAFYERLLPTLEDVAFCRMPLVWQDGAPTGWTFPGEDYEPGSDWARDLLLDNRIGSSAAIFTRDVWSRVGGFRSYRYVQDWRFWIDVALAGGRFALCPEPLASHRRHDAQQTATDALWLAESVQMLGELRVPLRYRAARNRGRAKLRIRLAETTGSRVEKVRLSAASALYAPRSAWAAVRESHPAGS